MGHLIKNEAGAVGSLRFVLFIPLHVRLSFWTAEATYGARSTSEMIGGTREARMRLICLST